MFIIVVLLLLWCTIVVVHCKGIAIFDNLQGFSQKSLSKSVCFLKIVIWTLQK